MPFKRGRWSQYGIEARIACVLGDLLAGAEVVADEIALGNIEAFAHPRIRQIENSQSPDPRLANTPNDFER
jgi:hypothetical protein